MPIPERGEIIVRRRNESGDPTHEKYVLAASPTAEQAIHQMVAVLTEDDRFKGLPAVQAAQPREKDR